MKAQSFVLLTLLLFVPVVSDSLQISPEINITTFVEDSDLVVYGEVKKKEFVFRQDRCTTHITICVMEMIKGKPNVRAKHVKFTLPGGKCDVSWDIVEHTPEFEVGEEVLLFLTEYTGDEGVFHVRGGKRLVQGLKVPIEYTFDSDGRREIHLPIDVAIQIAKAAVKHPKATRLLEEKIKEHILYSEMFTDTLKVKAKAIQEVDPPPTTEEMVIQFSNTITGLDRLASVRVTAAPFTLPEDDDTPIMSIKKRLLDSQHLWKVSYQVDALQHKNITNPHIKGFDVYVDIAQGLVLKIVSRDAEGLPEEFRKGIEVSNQQVRSTFRYDPYIRWDLPSDLPIVTPAYTLGEFLTGNGRICRHYECYYILYRQRRSDDSNEVAHFPLLPPQPVGRNWWFNRDNREKVVPRWLVILYGADPAEEEQPPPKPRTLADGYFRTLEIHFVDAMDGERFPFKSVTGKNTDTFK